MSIHPGSESGEPPPRSALERELPQVVDDARAYLEGVGMADRIELFAGSFFESMEGQGDCVVLRHVLHDWSDAE